MGRTPATILGLVLMVALIVGLDVAFLRDRFTLRLITNIGITVTVPDQNGHYTGTVGSFITLPSFIPPSVGSSQLQVAP